MTNSLIQPSFASGELAEALGARVDLARYQTGLRKCENFIISPYGGALNRPGTVFIAQTHNNVACRLIRFKFNDQDAYALEFTHLRMRVYRNGGLVLNSGGPNVGLPFVLNTPFTQAEIFDINFSQSADVMILVHPNHKPQRLSRFAHDNWTMADISFVPSISPPASASATTPGGGSGAQFFWQYQITAVKDDGTNSIEESLPVSSNTVTVFASNLQATVTWPAAPGATYYNIYKDNAAAGVFGFIGRSNALTFNDNNVAPVKTDTPPTGTDPFVGAGNFPSAVSYFQQRLTFGGSLNKPQTLWFSKTGIFNNFGYSIPTKDDDSITWTIASTEVNRIRHLTPLRALMTFTDGAEWTIQGTSAGFTPKTINGEPQTYNGIGQLRPLIINNTVIYAQERGRSVTAFGYSLESDGFSGNDISVLSPQMLEYSSLADWDFQKIPYSIVWGARNDGHMVAFTYVQEQQVIAWHRHITDGKVITVCSVPEGREDALYLCVQRTINGVVNHYVERMASRQIQRYGEVGLVKYAFFVDSGLTYDGTNSTSETMTLTGGVDWKYPETLTLTSSNGSRFVVGDVGDEIQYLATPASQPFRLSISAYTSGGVVSVIPVGEVPTAIRGVAFKNWAFARDRFAGLSHLEGKTVSILADGNVAPPMAVTAGVVTIPTAAAVVHIGLPYTSELETLEVTFPGQETVMDKRKVIRSVTAVLEDSRGGFYGRSNREQDLQEFKQRDEDDDYGSMALLTGKATTLIQDTWQGTGRVTVRQTDPLPMSILALIPQVDIGGAYP